MGVRYLPMMFAIARKVFAIFVTDRRLSDEELAAISGHKYSSVDISPISRLISVPIGHAFAWVIPGAAKKLVPTRLSANALTLVTLFLSIIISFLFAYYDPYFDASSAESKGYLAPIPNWLWLFTGIAVWIILVVDAADGIHARKTGTASPLGEFLDHGVDAWRTTFVFTMVVFSLFGRGTMGWNSYRQLNLLVLLQMEFMITILAPYLTDVLFYPISLELGHYYFIGVYIYTWYLGGSYVWQGYAYFYGNNAEFIELVAFGTILLVSIPSQLIFIAYKLYRNRNITAGNFKTKLSIVRKVSFNVVCWLLSLYSLAYLSSNEIINRDPRMFFLALSVVSAEISVSFLLCSITNAQSAKQVALVFSFVVISAVCIIGGRLGVFTAAAETMLLQWFALLAMVLHVLYMYRTAEQLRDHFGSSWLYATSTRLTNSEESPFLEETTECTR